MKRLLLPLAIKLTVLCGFRHAAARRMKPTIYFLTAALPCILTSLMTTVAPASFADWLKVLGPGLVAGLTALKALYDEHPNRTK